MQAEVMLKKTIDYLSGHLPGFAELIVKIVICALIYVIGKKLIAKLVRVVRAMLDKSHVSPGAADLRGIYAEDHPLPDADPGDCDAVWT